jgi:hypothetical protein
MQFVESSVLLFQNADDVPLLLTELVILSLAVVSGVVTVCQVLGETVAACAAEPKIDPTSSADASSLEAISVRFLLNTNRL